MKISHIIKSEGLCITIEPGKLRLLDISDEITKSKTYINSLNKTHKDSNFEIIIDMNQNNHTSLKEENIYLASYILNLIFLYPKRIKLGDRVIKYIKTNVNITNEKTTSIIKKLIQKGKESGKPNLWFVESTNYNNIVEQIVEFILKEVYDYDLSMMSDLKSLLVTSIGEMFANANYHSETEFFFYALTINTAEDEDMYVRNYIIDFGKSIPKSIEDYFNRTRKGLITEIDAFRWALEKGNTTRDGEGDRKISFGGVGLPLFIDSVEKLNGKHKIHSGHITYEDGKISVTAKHSFPETIIMFEFSRPAKYVDKSNTNIDSISLFDVALEDYDDKISTNS